MIERNFQRRTIIFSRTNERAFAVNVTNKQSTVIVPIRRIILIRGFVWSLRQEDCQNNLNDLFQMLPKYPSLNHFGQTIRNRTTYKFFALRTWYQKLPHHQPSHKLYTSRQWKCTASALSSMKLHEFSSKYDSKFSSNGQFYYVDDAHLDRLRLQSPKFSIWSV